MDNMTAWIKGVPVAKARPRVTMVGGKARAYTPKKSADWERQIAREWTHERQSAAVRLDIVFGMPIPQSWSKKQQDAAASGLLLPSKKPDIDNLIKAVMDALNGVAYDDDNQVIELSAKKVYAPEPSVCIWLRL